MIRCAFVGAGSVESRTMRYIIFIFGAVFLNACSVVPPVALTDFATVGLTDKTIEDHVVSAISGKDCSTVRTNQGRTYCAEDELNPEPKVHCYRTLGEVTCYDKPDPHANGHQKVNESTHNLLGRKDTERLIPYR